MSDFDLALTCQKSYSVNTLWDRLWTSGGVHVGMTDDTICFRGSDDLEDWMRDFDALAIYDIKLGGLHAGFARGIGNFFAVNQELFNSNTRVCGHSLGAARALIFAGFMASSGVIPKEVVVFGSPRPGFQKLTDILAPVTIRSYKNRSDPVTEVPVSVLPVFPYVHPRQAIKLNVPPFAAECDPLADHSIDLYAQGVENDQSI